jgi:hypothetical protein
MNQKQVGFWQIVFGIIALLYAFVSIISIESNTLRFDLVESNLIWLYFGLFALITGWYDLKSSQKKK